MIQHVCIWHLPDDSFRVRVCDDNWSLVRDRLLIHDEHWRAVCDGLVPIFRVEVGGRVEAISVCRAVLSSLDVPRRVGERPAVWMAADGSQVRHARNVQGLGLSGQAWDQAITGYGSNSLGYVAYDDCP